MRRPLIYLAIFTAFFWINWLSFGYLTSPINQKGQPDSFIISIFFILFFGAGTLLTTFITAAAMARRPNCKLPPLLIKDALGQGLIIGTWLTGLLMLQLLKSAGWINLTLWVIILLAVEWTIRESQKSKVKSQNYNSKSRK